MKRKCLSKLMAGALAVTIMTSSALSVEAAGSGYSGSGYVNTPVSAVSDIETTVVTNGGGDAASDAGTSGSSGSESNVVRNIVLRSDGTVLQTTVAGRYTSKKFAGTAVSSARANVDAALGVQKGEKAWVSISDSTCGQKAMKTVTDVAESMGAKTAGILDIYGAKITAAGKRVDVTHPAAEVQYTVGIPASMKAPAGYQLAVIRVYGEDGIGKADLLKDMDSDPATVTFSSDKFGVYAFVYIKNV